MNIREEMLEQAGVYKKRNEISRLITEGLYFNDDLDKSLRNAVSNGIITNSELRKLKNKSLDTEKAIEVFFEETLPKVEKALEERIKEIEQQIENASGYEESITLNENLEILREKHNRIRNI